jgi:SAM-dependent methyltransferase
MLPEETYDKSSELAADICAAWGIPHDLHRNDYILEYGIERLGLESAVHSYFHSGRHEAKQITETLEQLFIDNQNIKVLDFASGYGRIARHLNYFHKRNDLHAADIHSEAVEFMVDRLGLSAHLSNVVPESSEIGFDYDFIYVLSLFSHLPEYLFGRWIKQLFEKLKPGGYILFTTHGQRSLISNPVFFGDFYSVESGYGFKSASEQHDLDVSSYGTTVVSPQFVTRTLENLSPHILLHSFTSGKWFGNAFQDEYVIHKYR